MCALCYNYFVCMCVCVCVQAMDELAVNISAILFELSRVIQQVRHKTRQLI